MGEQAETPDQGPCLGIRCNIWARAKRRREITHHLRGGGKDMRWQELVGTDEVRFGKLRELRYLPKKIANFLHEFRAGDFPSLNLPPLPSNRGRLNVHAMLTPMHIAQLLRRLKVVLMCNNT